MEKNRLEAFSDGVFAIIITIMVLELRPPSGEFFSNLSELRQEFSSYLLSYLYLGTYWCNHHHLFSGVKKITGKVLLGNLNLLFWLSLFPFATDWVGQSSFSRDPVIFYGIVLFLSAISYLYLTKLLAGYDHSENILKDAVKGYKKEYLTIVLYLVAAVLSLFKPHFAFSIYYIIAALWLIPDKRIENLINKREKEEKEKENKNG